jgi:hypothetical protein
VAIEKGTATGKYPLLFTFGIDLDEIRRLPGAGAFLEIEAGNANAFSRPYSGERVELA